MTEHAHMHIHTRIYIYKIDKQQGPTYCIAQGTVFQYLVITCNGKEPEKECIYIHTYTHTHTLKSLCYIPETNITL